MKLDHWTIRTCESAYKVHNMNKKECVQWLIERGMLEDEAKATVKKWFR